MRITLEIFEQILKDAVGIQAKYGPGDCNLSGCLPQIEIAITSVPESQDSDPLELRVEGLNVESVFLFSPGKEILKAAGFLFCCFLFPYLSLRGVVESRHSWAKC